jgi:DNA-binding NtrC family response regulator
MARVTVLGALVRNVPEEARNQIRAAVREHDGNVTHAADALEISHRMMLRWIVDLGIQRDIDLIRKELGKEPGVPTRRRKKGA